MSKRLDWTDPRAVVAWLGEVRVAVDDANGVALDMLRTPRKRDLGHREHARLHREAREARFPPRLRHPRRARPRRLRR